MCAGEKLRINLNSDELKIADNYLKECQLKSNLHHPNIAQFMGLVFLLDHPLPLLVIEQLEESLDDLLKTVPHIPLILKRSILEDVARGLQYLHEYNPQIIHGDLTAKNVLLTSSLAAKINDFGSAHIMSLKPDHLSMYMPPEASIEASDYGSSFDIFSFGHLTLVTLTQVWLSCIVLCV